MWRVLSDRLTGVWPPFCVRCPGTPHAWIYAEDPCSGSPTCQRHFCGFLPEDRAQLPKDEVTIADALGALGYRTGMAGKWHLGIGAGGAALPTHHGFDSYYGLPFTHDDCASAPLLPPTNDPEQGPCMEFANATVAVQPSDVWTIDGRYLLDAKRHITAAVSAGEPFFYHFASHHTHMPQFPAPSAVNQTVRGDFGDSLLTLDTAVGQLLDHLETEGVAQQTLTWFTSDNGPQLYDLDLSGSAGPFKCGKGTYFEGGVSGLFMHAQDSTASAGLVLVCSTRRSFLGMRLELTSTCNPFCVLLRHCLLGPCSRHRALARHHPRGRRQPRAHVHAGLSPDLCRPGHACGDRARGRTSGHRRGSGSGPRRGHRRRRRRRRRLFQGAGCGGGRAAALGAAGAGGTHT